MQKTKSYQFSTYSIGAYFGALLLARKYGNAVKISADALLHALFFREKPKMIFYLQT